MKSLGIFVCIAFLAVCTAVPFFSREERSVPAVQYYQKWCCPKLLNASSRFRPIGNCQVQAAAITNFGNCSVPVHKGFWWFVDWGDGHYDSSCTSDLGPFDPPDHYYESDYCLGKKRQICISVWYCNSVDSEDNYCSYNADCCDHFWKCIYVY